jgi:ribosomal protein S18 acetylase RimI-like enzyme
MPELIKISSASNKQILSLCNLMSEIWGEYFLEFFEKEKLDYILSFNSPDVIKDEIKIDNSRYFFIKYKDEIVGFLQLQYYSWLFALKRIYIKKEFRNKSIGYKVFQKVKEIALAENNKVISILVNQNDEKMIRTFERWGFKKQEILTRYIGNDFYLEDYKMEYAL